MRAPTLWNVAFLKHLFWDARAESLAPVSTMVAVLLWMPSSALHAKVRS